MKSKFVLTCTILFVLCFTCVVCAEDTDTKIVVIEPLNTIQNEVQTDSEKNNENKEVSSHEHTWKEDLEKSKKPTCTEKGYTYYLCDECKETKKEEIKATGHKFDDWKNVNDVKERKCKICGFTEQEKLSKAKTTPTPTPTSTNNTENRIILHNTNIQNVEAYNILENGILKPSGADKTVANKIIPAAGKEVMILPGLIVLLIIYVQYRKYKKI